MWGIVLKLQKAQDRAFSWEMACRNFFLVISTAKKLIVSNIELSLNYCVRFYDRQFITPDHANNGVLEKFDNLLNEYFHSDKPQEVGILTVAHFANELHLSAN